MTSSEKSSFRIYLLFFFIILAWAFSWPIGKFALSQVSTPWLIATRLLIGAVCIFGVAASLGKLRLPEKKDLPIIASVGILQFFLFTTLSLWGLKYTEAGQSALLSYTTP